MSTEIDNTPLDLNVDLRAVDTSMPVLVKGLKELKIAGMTREANKEQTGYNLVVTFETVNPEMTIQGREVKPGFKMKSWYPLQSKDNDDRHLINLAMLQEAALGEKQDNFRSTDLIGRKVVADVKVDSFQDQPNNKIGRLTKAD